MDWVGNKGHDVRLPYNYLSKAEWNAVFDSIKVAPVTWNQQLGLYPPPFSLAFDRSLHFIATVRADALHWSLFQAGRRLRKQHRLARRALDDLASPT